jgi:hypothetical protein
MKNFNLQNILEQIKDLSSEAKDAVFTAIINAMQASAVVEKTTLSQIKNEVDKAKLEGYTVNTKSSSLLLNDFSKGKTTTVTEEYRKKFNLILEKSLEYEKKLNPYAIKIDEDGNVTIDRERLYLSESQLKEKYESGIHKNPETIALSINNKIICLNENDYLVEIGQKNREYFYPVILHNSGFDGIEKFITQCIVRKTPNDEYFYIEIYTKLTKKDIPQLMFINRFQHDAITLAKRKNNETYNYEFIIMNPLSDVNIMEHDNRYFIKALYRKC